MANPFVFVVGCPRSGTTLLRHIMDIHPQMAVIPESGCFATWYEQGTGLTPEGFVTPELISALLRTSRNIELGVETSELYGMVESNPKIPYASFVSAFFDRYGQMRRKSLVGGKNPDFLRHLDTLHKLWPSAKFVHIIRDGRDICLSASLRWKDKPGFKGMPFFLWEPSDQACFENWSEDPVITAALWWEWNVRLGREFGCSVESGLYYEIRYESLVTRPRTECEALCEFLGLPFDEAMLRHQENFKPRRNAAGHMMHARVALPITAGLRDWRSQMSPAEVVRFEAAVGRFLEDLGYPRGSRQLYPENLEQASLVRNRLEARARSLVKLGRATAGAAGFA